MQFSYNQKVIISTVNSGKVSLKFDNIIDNTKKEIQQSIKEASAKIVSRYAEPHVSLTNNDNLSEKHILLRKLRANSSLKFKRGDYLTLRTIIKGHNINRIERIFQIKQIVWSIDLNPIKAVVVKQVYGPNFNMFSLNHSDCKKLHVKYEQGLQLLSMELPWIIAQESTLNKLNYISNE